MPFPVSIGEAIAWDHRRVTPRDVLKRLPIEDPEAGCVDCGEGVEAADQPCSGPGG